MKTRLFAVLLLLAGCASAPKAQESNTAAEAEIQQELDAMRTAWNRDDLDAHLAPYSDEATWTTATGLLRGKPIIRDNLVKAFMRGDELLGELSFGPAVFRRLGPDAYVTNSSFTVGNLPNGKPINGQATLIWKRTGGKWQVIHDHSS